MNAFIWYCVIRWYLVISSTLHKTVYFFKQTESVQPLNDLHIWASLQVMWSMWSVQTGRQTHNFICSRTLHHWHSSLYPLPIKRSYKNNEVQQAWNKKDLCSLLKRMTAHTDKHVVLPFTPLGKYLNSESLNMQYKQFYIYLAVISTTKIISLFRCQILNLNLRDLRQKQNDPLITTAA